jgi:hypothetical protein
MMSRFVVTVVALLLVWSVTTVHSDDAEQTNAVLVDMKLSAKQMTVVIEQARQRLKSNLAALAGDRLTVKEKARSVQGARALCVLLAVYADAGPVENVNPPVVLRENALRLGVAVGEGKWTDADKLWKELLPVEKVSELPKKTALFGPSDHVALVKGVMILLRSRDRGGLGSEPAPKDLNDDGLEAVLRILETEPKKAAALKREDLLRLSWQTAILAEMTRLAPPPSATGRKKEIWNNTTREMREQALNLARAAKEEKNLETLGNLAGKINTACIDCHRVFP